MKTLTGDEHFMLDGKPVNFLLNDFWAWQASDLLNNALRGVLAEFIVARALGIDTAETRREWDAYDLIFDGRWRIEVKSSAFLQSWEQKAPSRLQFSIRPTRTWSGASACGDEARRQSDLYVFCVFTATDRATAAPINLDQWDFYVLPTKRLNDMSGHQQTISLPSLLTLAPLKADYGILAAKVRLAIADAYPELSTYNTDKLEWDISTYEHNARAGG